MEYAEELNFIKEKIYLRIKTKLSRISPQIKFLNKYKEFAKPAITNLFKIKVNF